jgi:AcrR family transcriptional regulator
MIMYIVCFLRFAMSTLDRPHRKRDRTASRLSATAYALFEAHGYGAVSMEQIADVADVAKATLYKYFPVKEALLAHRFREDVAAGMAERAEALAAHSTFAARMRYLLSESAEWHSQRKVYLPHLLRFLTAQAHYGDLPEQPTPRSDTWQILTAMFRSGQLSGEVRTNARAEDIAWSFQYLLFAAMSAWLLDSSRDLRARFLDAFDLAMHGLVPPQASTLLSNA